MLQTTLYDAALKDCTVTPARLPQLISAAAALIVPIGIAKFTIPSTDSSQAASRALAVVHSLSPMAHTAGNQTARYDYSRIGSVMPNMDRAMGRRCPMEAAMVQWESRKSARTAGREGTERK